jgi:hypothetical protein
MHKELDGHAELACILSDDWISHPSSILDVELSKLSIASTSNYEHIPKPSFRVYTSQTPVGACQPSCKCKCHQVSPRPLPHHLRRTFRSLFPKVQGDEHMMRRCSRLECRKSNARLGQIFFVLRSVFLSKAIRLSTMARGLQLKIQVKTYRVIRECSEVIRYVQVGNLEGLKRVISYGQATPNDMGEDGWSLLHVKGVRSCR